MRGKLQEPGPNVKEDYLKFRYFLVYVSREFARGATTFVTQVSKPAQNGGKAAIYLSESASPISEQVWKPALRMLHRIC
jgi:hypothetical protein